MWTWWVSQELGATLLRALSRQRIVLSSAILMIDLVEGKRDSDRVLTVKCPHRGDPRQSCLHFISQRKLSVYPNSKEEDICPPVIFLEGRTRNIWLVPLITSIAT